MKKKISFTLIILSIVFSSLFFLLKGTNKIIPTVKGDDPSPEIHKSAVDSTGNAITSVNQGDNINYVVDIKNASNKIIDLKINDNGLSSNQTFVFNPYKNASYNPITNPTPSPKVPYALGQNNTINKPAWEQTSGKNVSTGDVTYPNGNWAYELNAVSSPTTGIVGSIPGQDLSIILDTFGDGYTPIFITMPDGEKRLYAIWHHQYVNEPYGPYPDGSIASAPSEYGATHYGQKFPNIMCVSITHNAACAGFGTYTSINTSGTKEPKYFTSIQDSASALTAQQLAAYSTGAPAKDIATTLYPKYHVDSQNGRIYYLSARQKNPIATSPAPDLGANRTTLFNATTRQAEIGIGCWDYLKDTNCDGSASGDANLKSFYKFADLNFSMWFNTSITQPTMAEGLYFANNKFYFYYQDSADGDYTTADAIKFGCYDMNTFAPCTSYPITYPGVTSFKETFKAPFEVYNNKMYVMLNRSQYLSTTGTSQSLTVMCFDTTTNAKCTGWTDVSVGAGIISRNNGSDFGNANSIFNLDGYGICIGYDNANSSGGNGATQSSYCFDYSTGTQIGAMNNYANVIQDNVTTHGDYNVTLKMPDGTTQNRIYISQDKIQTGDAGDVNRVYCYYDDGVSYKLCPDFGKWNGATYLGYRDLNDCTETDENGVLLQCEPLLNIQYGYTIDPETQCMYGLGHSGNMYAMDPFTGSLPCLRSHGSKYMMNVTQSMYCDGSTTRQTDWKWGVRIFNPPAGTYAAKFFDPVNTNPTTAPEYTDGIISVTTPGAVDYIDLIPALLSPHPSMAVAINTWESVLRPVSTNLAYSLFYYKTIVGDAPNPQFCFKTTLPDKCNIGTVSNKADLEWNLSSYPLNTPPATYTTISSNILTLTVNNKATCSLSLGDTVWLDTDHDGIQDSTESGVKDVKVNLYPWGSTTVSKTMNTDTSGKYLFDNIPSGDYMVEIIPPTGYAITDKDKGTDNSIDSDIDTTTYKTDKITLSASNDLSWDAGLLLGCIGDFVWDDLDGDGVQDTGEPGIAGVEVTLVLPDGTTKVTTTDVNGLYKFCNLTGGSYTVKVLTPQDIITKYPSYSNGWKNTTQLTLTITLKNGEINLNEDFGFTKVLPKTGVDLWWMKWW